MSTEWSVTEKLVHFMHDYKTMIFTTDIRWITVKRARKWKAGEKNKKISKCKINWCAKKFAFERATEHLYEVCSSVCWPSVRPSAHLPVLLTIGPYYHLLKRCFRVSEWIRPCSSWKQWIIFTVHFLSNRIEKNTENENQNPSFWIYLFWEKISFQIQ